MEFSIALFFVPKFSVELAYFGRLALTTQRFSSFTEKFTLNKFLIFIPFDTARQAASNELPCARAIIGG